MVFLIRDYLDTLSHTVSDSQAVFLTFEFAIRSLGVFFNYLFTFRWFQDIMALPIILPKFANSVVSEHFFYEQLDFSWSHQEGIQGILIIGILNGLFCSLPVLTVHWVNIRRIVVQGLSAGIASTAGVIFGQSTFVLFTITGLRSLIIPWVSLDPLTYFFGLCLLVYVVFETVQAGGVFRQVRPSETWTLTKIFVISLLLTWTDQSTFYPHLSNLTLSNQTSLLSGGESIAHHLSYVFGLTLGQIVFSSFFIWFFYSLSSYSLRFGTNPISLYISRFNIASLGIAIGLSVSSIPFYSFDYLFAGPLGFVSQDTAFEKSIFSQQPIPDEGEILTAAEVFSLPVTIDIDISLFDRGNFGDKPGFFRRSFEEFNYQAEYAWLCRFDRKPDLFITPPSAEIVMSNILPQLPQAVDVSENVEVIQRQEPRLQSRITYNKLDQRYRKNYLESRERQAYLLGETLHHTPTLRKRLGPVETSLKQKYYANPVYKALLNVEMDAFLKRQPASHQLTQKEQVDILRKRYLLSRYHDSIREYQKIPYQEGFQLFFNGSKSFVDRFYHHQFKGSLNVTRRLFKVTFDKTENPFSEAVLSYDKPLYTSGHERHEELQPFFPSNPLMDEVDAMSPFYVGWDNETRRFFVTRKYESSIPKFRTTNTGTSVGQMQFMAWPLEAERLMSIKIQPNNKAITLFEPKENPEMSYFSGLSLNLSSIWNFPMHTRYFGKSFSNVAPVRGGVVWQF